MAPLVDVQGGHDPSNGGGIYFVDVVVRKATLLERLFGGLHEGADLHSPQEVVPPGLNDSEEHQVDLADMQRSQEIAAAVALRALGEKVRATPTGGARDRHRRRAARGGKAPPHGRHRRRRRQAGAHAPGPDRRDEEEGGRLLGALHRAARFGERSPSR